MKKTSAVILGQRKYFLTLKLPWEIRVIMLATDQQIWIADKEFWMKAKARLKSSFKTLFYRVAYRKRIFKKSWKFCYFLFLFSLSVCPLSLRWQIPLFWWWKKVGNSPGRSQPIVKISKPQFLPFLLLQLHKFNQHLHLLQKILWRRSEKTAYTLLCSFLPSFYFLPHLFCGSESIRREREKLLSIGCAGGSKIGTAL